jgi:hypothetical protein
LGQTKRRERGRCRSATPARRKKTKKNKKTFGERFVGLRAVGGDAPSRLLST